MIDTIIPWLVGAGFMLLAVVGAFFRGKSTGKEEVRQDVAAKINQQAAEAAKVVRDVQNENRRLPPGAAADLLHARWGMRKQPGGGK